MYGDLICSVQTVNNFHCFVIIRCMYVFVSEDHMLEWHSCQRCYPLWNKVIIVITNLFFKLGFHAGWICTGSFETLVTLSFSEMVYGTGPFSSNTLAVWTVKIILRTSSKTYSFSSNNEFLPRTWISNTSNTKSGDCQFYVNNFSSKLFWFWTCLTAQKSSIFGAHDPFLSVTTPFF